MDGFTLQTPTRNVTFKYVSWGSHRATVDCSLPPERQRLCGMRKREREVGSGVAGDRRERGGVLT